MTTHPTQPRHCDVTTLRERLAGPDAPRILDVRTPAEFHGAHIPGSYNVPLDTLKEHRDELRQHLDEDVVLVCRSGQRAAQAEDVLRRVGLPGLRILEGGIVAWQDDDAPVNRGRQTWELERQVRLLAGSIVAVAVLLSVVVDPVKWVAFAIGAGLAVAALTNTCAMGMMLARMPWNRRGASCDVDDIVAALAPGAATR